MGTFLGAMLFGFVIYEIFINPTKSVFLSKRQIMANVRNKNAKKGIYLQPGKKYKDLDGEIHYSLTGRLEDLVVIMPNGNRLRGREAMERSWIRLEGDDDKAE